VEDKDRLNQNIFRNEVTQPPEVFRTLEKKPYRLRQRQAMQLQGLGQLTNQIIHQMNNLLGPIGAYLDEMRINGDEKDTAHTTALSAYIQIIELVKKLKTFGKPSAAELSPVDINEIVANTIMMVQTLHREFEFQHKLTEGLPSVLANPVDIQQMLLNLLINAYDAIKEKKILGYRDRPNIIRVFTKQVIVDDDQNISSEIVNSRKCILISIEDTGIGIAGENTERIFEPYFTTKPDKGTGIGLTIVNDVVKKYNGWIDVDSIYRYGTTFSVYLPIVTKTK